MSEQDPSVWRVEINYSNIECPHRVFNQGISYCNANMYNITLMKCSKETCPKIVKEEN